MPVRPRVAARDESFVPRSRANLWRLLPLLGSALLFWACGTVKREPPPSALRTLTPLQYQASLQAIFGEEVPASSLGPRRTSLAAASAGIGSSMQLAYEASALEIGDWAFNSDPERREGLAGCSPLAAKDDPCLAAVLTRIGRLAFRRSLTEEELQRYLGLAADLGSEDPWRGLALAVAALLQSPNFLYREEATAGGEGDYLRYSPLTIATRLAFLLWNAPPDEALVRAAEEGELDTTEGVAALVPGMLADARAEAGRARLLAELFHVDLLLDLEKDPRVFPDFDAGLRDAIAQQLQRTLNEVARGGVLADVFVSKRTFLNQRLAELYGIEGEFGDELEEVQLPADSPRGGVLTSPAILASRAYPGHTSVALRGLFVRKDLLCQDIPPPPPDVNPSLRPPDKDELVTTRDLLAEHQTTPSCWGCHAQMDPIGLALENFDASGRYRETQNGLVIDPSGDLDGVAFADAIGLGEALAEHPGLDPCFAINIYSYGVGRVLAESERAELASLIAHESDGRLALDAVLRIIATSPSFSRHPGEEGPQ